MYTLIFYVLAAFFWLFFRVLFRWRVRGLENIPDGGAIIAPNHQSIWDIPLVALALCGRRTHFMAKSELFRNPAFGWIIRTLLAFPVKRGAPDRAAIRYAIDLLKQGELVVIFPEGTRSKDGQLKDAEPGLALIVGKAEVPVIPVGITGTRRIFSKGCRFPQVRVSFGEPIADPPLKPANGEKTSDIGAEVMQEIRDLIHS